MKQFKNDKNLKELERLIKKGSTLSQKLKGRHPGKFPRGLLTTIRMRKCRPNGELFVKKEFHYMI
jgi:hypothetical protein